MEQAAQFPVIESEVDGHALSLYASGTACKAALLRVISEAQNALRLFYYTFSDDDAGREIVDALLAARRRGVSVTLMVDGFGSSDTPDSLFQDAVAAGVIVCRFLPRWGRRYLLRNHQKMAIADDHVALIGGVNIADAYFAHHADSKGWHDLMLRVDGPAAGRLAGYHKALTRWTQAENSGIRTLLRMLGRRSDRRGAIRWLFGGPFRRASPLTRGLRRDIAAAKNLDMVQAYFAPNWAMLRRIGQIARRGGRARIITAAQSDNQTTIAAARHCYRRLLRNGVEVAEYRPQMLHMKLIAVDDVVYVGSANFDMRSLYINAEIMLRIEDAGFAGQVRDFIAAHLPVCELITRESHRARSGWFTRLRWLFGYFLVSIVDFNVTRRFGFVRD